MFKNVTLILTFSISLLISTNSYSDGDNRELSLEVVDNIPSRTKECNIPISNIEADLENCNFSSKILNEYNFIGANLVGADFTNSQSVKSLFNDADLTNAIFTNAELSNSNFSNANLTGADLSNADFSRTNLRGADLTNVTFSNTNLTKATWTDGRQCGSYSIDMCN